MAADSPLIRLYDRLESLPLGLGRRAFSLAYQAAAPYFLTIPARIETITPGAARASLAPVPWTRNHLGTVHAIALCNLAEFTMGAVAEATIPASHRWVPKGMSVEYLAKARGRLSATATLDLPEPLLERQELPVAITVADTDRNTVFTAEIRIWVTAKPSKESE